MELAIRAFQTAALAHSQLLIIGDGSQKDNCVSLIDRLQISHVRFLSCVSPDDVPAMQSMADVCLLPLKRGVALNAVPSKLPAYLFSVKPVMAMLDAESFSARCIQEAQCGWVGEPENVEWLAAKMREVAAMPTAELEAMGQRGRAYGLQHFSKSEGVRKLADVVMTAQRICNEENADQPRRK
jgi:glycosyltransferase involved in cell wall biosynthesis